MTAVLLLGEGGRPAAERILQAVPGAVLHGYAPRIAEATVRFDEVAAHLRGLFAAGEPIVGLCAAGILIRALAPLLADKQSEPPVVAVAEDGSAAVPLLGGHHGANELARTIAAALGGTAAITTAGDLRLGLALDAPPPGFRLADAAAVKPAAAALLAGAPAALSLDAAPEACGWLSERLAGRAADPAQPGVPICVTDRAAVPGALTYHPATLALGVGCERGVEPAALQALLEATLAETGWAAGAVACVASIALKAAEPAIHALAGRLGVPARFLDAAALAAETPRLANPSEVVFAETGCWGVAEGAALAAAGADAALVVPKRRGARVTLAIARSPRPIDPAAVGRPRGELAIVGLGPGEAAGRTGAADAALRAAEDIVGYRLYLDLLGPLAAGKALHGYALGEESVRVAAALDLAAAGRRVALVGSGDAGIYAMASLVFELIERSGNPDWARVAISGVPGVSAMQVAAARAGAPLGHDFCAISLSDLLTPWPAIVTRLEAAAAGDFVVALYNPVSQRRRHQLADARAILLRRRPPETPVVIARNLGRDGEAVTLTTLAGLDPDRVDMLSVVLVGSSATRLLARPEGGAWVYTPRGYAAKEVPA
jgi:cobalt-precorrin 5A hydrolase/precorrin-3B C17-methyltransferase